MCNNLNNEKKERIKIEDSKRKKRHDNLNNNEKEHLRKYDEKGKTLDERSSIFNNVQMCSMVDPSILTTPAFRFIEKVFKTAILEGPTYICDIFWKFKFQRNVIKLKELEHHTDICNECTSGKSCKNCHKMSKNKMPMQAQLHKLEFCPKFTELDRLSPIELMPIPQITSYVYCYKQESCPVF